jgi:hypothetical protein
MHWLTRRWWVYLLSGCRGWSHFRCRLRGHPSGVWWYTGADAMEPDMHCRDCGDDLA